jgi:hypothetical protein
MASAALILQACCKAYCGVETFSIRFINYKVSDIDTVLFSKYVANGKFDQKLDSVFVYTYYTQTDTIYSGFTQNIEFDKDWVIKIPNTGKEYHITEIGTTNERCTCTNNTSKALASYRLDSVLHSSNYFDLKK